MKCLGLLYAMLILPFANVFGYQFGGVNFYTPEGNNICDCNELENYQKNAPAIVGFENEMPRIKRFYFYRDHIVGFSDSLHFIFNEKSKVLEVFDSEKEWEERVEYSCLDPWVTRWWELDDSPSDLILLLMVGFIVTIPLGSVFLFFWIGSFWKAISKEKFSLRKGINTKVFLGLSLVLMWGWSELFWLESI